MNDKKSKLITDMGFKIGSKLAILDKYFMRDDKDVKELRNYLLKIYKSIENCIINDKDISHFVEIINMIKL